MRAAESAGLAVDAATAAIALIPIPGSGRAADALSRLARGVVSERVARWAANKAVDGLDGAVKGRIADAVREVTMSKASESAISGTWAATVAASTDGGPATRESLEVALGAWVELLSMDGSSLSEHATIEDFLLNVTGNCGDIFESARRQAPGGGK